jgi:hypothetical protein
MEATTTQPQPAAVPIPEAHRAAAERYIAAILRRDPGQGAVGDADSGRGRELLAEFEFHYRRVGHGPYARHGADALRIALGRL